MPTAAMSDKNRQIRKKMELKKIKLHWPQLDVSYGDVRALEFEDDSFDGYWSLGVIEHFPDGYEDIGQEMTRVITLS